MILRKLICSFAILAALSSGLAAIPARADFVGSFSLETFGAALDTQGLATASTFYLPDNMTGNPGTGGFSSIPINAPFSGTSFTLDAPTGLVITSTGTGSSYFGTFTQTAAPVLSQSTIIDNVVVAESFYILGNYLGGPVGSVETPASFLVTFNQNGGPTASVSASGNIVIPPAAIPEPSSVIMLSLGLLGFGGIAVRRRFANS